MGFFSFIVLLGIAYLLWRVSDQMPDLIFRLSEIQRDIAEIRRRQSGDTPGETARPSTAPSTTTGSVNSNTSNTSGSGNV